MSGRYTLTINQRFSCAHFLRDYEGPCARMHGHDYLVEVEVSTDRLNPQGLAIDSSKLLTLLTELTGSLDHRCLNELPPFVTINPSAENIAAWFYQQLKPAIIRQPNVALDAIIIHETEKFSVRYTEPC